MGIGERIEAAVTPIVAACVPHLYGGRASEYCVYNYTEVPDLVGDDEPELIRCMVQVHWLFPWEPGISERAEIRERKRKLRSALAAAGMTCPTVTPAGDQEWEHYIFEGEMLEEV